MLKKTPQVLTGSIIGASPVNAAVARHSFNCYCNSLAQSDPGAVTVNFHLEQIKSTKAVVRQSGFSDPRMDYMQILRIIME